MTLQRIPSKRQVESEPAASLLADSIEESLDSADGEAYFFHKFPLYKDIEGENILADALLVSPRHGVVAFSLPDQRHSAEINAELFEQVPAFIHSRLIRNRQLRSNSTTLAVQLSAAIVRFDENMPISPVDASSDVILASPEQLSQFLLSLSLTTPLSATVLTETLATIDGAKGLLRTTERTQPTSETPKKARIAYAVETALTDFDLKQKHGMFGEIEGLTRIRGIAGSGKTVVLAMKAAMYHLRYPDRRILYTFHTKSLYQQVRRLITRFYRQFDDRDPDWNRIEILHAWGGAAAPGVYSDTCDHYGIRRMSLTEVPKSDSTDPLGFVCDSLLKSARVQPQYDLILMDEGQDFAPGFMRLCFALAKESRFVMAYDELQNLFQPTAPEPSKVFVDQSGRPLNLPFTEDVILRTCYRNPREILVVAHAVGFGLYGNRIVQILEDERHWEAVGYKLVGGHCRAGAKCVLERPEDTSLTVVSKMETSIDEIVQASAFETLDEELEYVTSSIQQDIATGLQPEDILVVCVDDRNAKTYLGLVARMLVERGIGANNIHEAGSGLRDFSIKRHVTLSTVHKAKGNEAFMVYVMGTDAPMQKTHVKQRNMLFTAMTRAKAWLRMSGMGSNATQLTKEVTAAKRLCPRLEFSYPEAEEIEVIRKDLATEFDSRKSLREIAEALSEGYSSEEIAELLADLKKRQDGVRKSLRRPEKGSDGNK